MRLVIVCTCAVLTALFLQSADAGRVKVKKSKAELAPMSEPAPWKEGYTRILLINGKTEAMTLISRTPEGLTFRQAGCEYTRREQTLFAPAISWRNCPGGSDGTRTYQTKGEIWPLVVGKTWSYESKGENVRGDAWSDVRRCKVQGVYHVTTEGGEYDSYKVTCTSSNWTRIYYVSPELKTTVYFKRTHDRGKKPTMKIQLIREEDHPVAVASAGLTKKEYFVEHAQKQSVAVASAGLTKKEYFVEHAQKQWGEPQADKALVYILRPATTMPTKMWAFADETLLGVTKSDSYIYAYVSPGEHVFWSKAENINAIRMRVEAGKTYYIQQHVRLGVWKMAVELEVLDEPEATRLLEQCQYLTSTERAAAKSRKYVKRGYKEARAAASTFPYSRRGKTFSY